MEEKQDYFEHDLTFWQRLVFALTSIFVGFMAWAVIYSEAYLLIPLVFWWGWVLLSTKTHFNRVMRKLHAPKFMIIKPDKRS